MKPKALFLTTQYPFDSKSGGTLVTLEHLKFVSQSYRVDLLCKAENPPNKANLASSKAAFGLGQVHVFKHWIKTSEHPVKAAYTYLKCILSASSYKITKHHNKQLIQKLKYLIGRNSYDVIFIDQLPAFTAEVFGAICAKVVLFTHNAEFQTVSTQLSGLSRGLKKVLLQMELKKLKRYEEKVYSNVGNVIFLSSEDRDCFGDLANSCIVPSYASLFHPTDFFDAPIHGSILMIGSWSWSLNRDGLFWFVQNVMPSLAQSHLTIIGAGLKPKDHALLAKHNNVKVMGIVEDLSSFYEEHAVVAIPLFGGSGVKIKVVEAMSYGKPIVTTDFGVQGILYKEGICVENNAKSFIHQINELCDNKLYYKLKSKELVDSFCKLAALKPDKVFKRYMIRLMTNGQVNPNQEC